MDKKIIEALSKKFNKEDIKKRPGSFGKSLSYIESHKVIERANEALNGDWSFEVLTRPTEMIIGDYVVAHVRISVPQYDEHDHLKYVITRDGVGGKKIGKIRGSNDYLDLASDIKAATSDACKKAFTTLGIALDLYGSDDEVEKDESKKDEAKPAGPVPATMNQKNAITSIIKAKNLDLAKTLSQHGVKDFNALEESVAKDIIVALNKV